MLIYSIIKQKDLKNIPYWVKWIELRIDLSPDLVNYLEELKDYYVIITDRCISEGGKSRRDYREKLKYYQEFEFHDNIFFDMEIDIIDVELETSLDFSKYFLSYHNFSKVNYAKITSILEKAEAYSPYMIKLAQQCLSFKEVRQIYEICKKYKENILWLVMGKYGKLQRLLFPYLNSAGSYIATKGNETVEGQLNIESVENYQHLASREIFKWGGIIGGSQVYNSLGLNHYNSHFRANNLKAVYLPISLAEDDVIDFFELVKSNSLLQKHCYGFSLTMPFKKLIPSLFQVGEISNLLINNSPPKFYNTDKDAFVKIKKKLVNKNISKVLIYGSGAMAELAIQVFSGFSITLMARKKNKLAELKSQYKDIEIIDHFTGKLYFDLLVNTSPLGMNGEDFSQITGISNFKYVIDLPYSEDEIPLAKQVDEDKYFSGKEFWEYQSEKQMQFFKERIENDKE